MEHQGLLLSSCRRFERYQCFNLQGQAFQEENTSLTPATTQPAIRPPITALRLPSAAPIPSPSRLSQQLKSSNEYRVTRTVAHIMQIYRYLRYRGKGCYYVRRDMSRDQFYSTKTWHRLRTKRPPFPVIKRRHEITYSRTSNEATGCIKDICFVTRTQ